jgi:protein-tyrosine kinase
MELFDAGSTAGASSPTCHSETKMTAHPMRYTKTRVVKPDPDLLRERRLVMGLRNDARAQMFRILRTKVLMQLRERNFASLAITSATPGAGKSFVTANLAIALAMEVNQTVLVVDADLRHPRIDWYFGFPVYAGLLDYLRDNHELENILVNPGIERLVVLPGKGTTDQSSELLSSPKMSNLVKDLKSKYDSRIILFDMPPLLACDDTLIFMPHFDAALFVVEDGRNSAEEIRRSLQLLERTNLLGTVLNKGTTVLEAPY